MGGRERLPIDVRWISSAQEGLEARAAAEPFRRDLLAHLNVITLRVPPLREYAEDVPDLCATTWTGWSTSSICRCGASAWPRKTACETTLGRATSAN